MRTTLTLEEDLALALRKKAYETEKSFKEVVNETLRLGLQAERTATRAKPYRIQPASLGGVLPGIDLDKALQLADEIEDTETARRLELRK